VFEGGWTDAEEMRFSLFVFVLLISCGQKVTLPSIKNGSNQFVTCYFDSSPIYKDVVFEVRYDSRNNNTELMIKNPQRSPSSRYLSKTENRLTLTFPNQDKKEVILDVFFLTGSFSMKLNDYEYSGVCEEKIK
jgi:hypothetical protein